MLLWVDYLLGRLYAVLGSRMEYALVSPLNAALETKVDVSKRLLR